MCLVNLVVSNVAAFCLEFENRLAKDGEFANCLLQTNKLGDVRPTNRRLRKGARKRHQKTTQVDGPSN